MKQNHKNKKPQLAIHQDENGDPISGVGPGVGIAFVKSYFPKANHTIRIASAYFTLSGHKLARSFIKPTVQIRILVGDEEGWNVHRTVEEEVLSDLGQCSTDIWSAVNDLVERIQQGKFVIRDAREMKAPFHAKFYICDESYFWHGSTNYSNRGLKVAAEQASAISNKEQIKQFIDWYDAVAEGAKDLLAELLTRLKAWLELATPFDLYLKTLLLLDDIPSYPLQGNAHMPTYFQKGVIAQALHQLDKFGGALVVVATGLGKTVIGADIALRLIKNGSVKRVLIIAPQNVQNNWAIECEGREFNPKMFDNSVAFLKSSQVSYHQVQKLEDELKNANSNMLIIIDEAHYYRNQLVVEDLEVRKSKVFARFTTAITAGAKIVLLTATAYSTNIQNFNSLLRLLPSNRNHGFGFPSYWNASNTENFAALPVVTILGIPHVIHMARNRGDIEEDGRVFIQLVKDKRYLPKKIILKAPRFKLFLESDLQKAFDQYYFSQYQLLRQKRYDEESRTYIPILTDSIYNSSLSSWLSSPREMIVSIRKNIATKGKINVITGQSLQAQPIENDLNRVAIEEQEDIINGQDAQKPYKSALRLSQNERELVLAPLLSAIEQISPTSDDKFLKLRKIIEEHCLDTQNKVLIFVRRLFTASYLAEELSKLFSDRLNIGCTIEHRSSVPKLKEVKQRAEILKSFSPCSHNYIPKTEYDVLICTDADGVGVNLQDANVVVHYDPPLGADILFQRVGRILRMTSEPNRTLHIYTLVPSCIDQNQEQSQIFGNIRELFNRITRRHETSRQILGAGILSIDEYSEITLDNEADIAQFASDNEFIGDVGGVGVESRLRHIALLEQYYEQAVQIPDYIQSARGTDQARSQMFVLIKYETKYIPIIYILADQTIEVLEEYQILDRISCKIDESRAAIPAEAIEHFANQAVQYWCKLNQINIENVTKICSMCLVPQGKADEVANLFKNIARLEKAL